jgi:threonine/homoserine/homoserine lactone efflux protein
MLGRLVAFLGVSAVVICVPGPDTALTVRNALAGGRRCGVATAAGVAAGQAVWTLATSVGIAELIQASEPAFLVMKTVGAAYLVALGLQSLLTAAGLRSRWTAAGLRSRWTAAGSRSLRMGPGRALRQGMVSNLANPKMAAFFLSLLPQFASPEQGAGGIVGLGLVFCAMTFGWLGLYSVAVDRARAVLSRSWVRRALDGVSGVVLVGFGARLALQQR